MMQILCLSRKKVVLEVVADLRLIALCNVVYKIMAKIVANRMKSMLKNIVSNSQSAFLLVKLIINNILIAS